ncbi:hypothetical protein KC19_4G269100 [Ceratodon purpureus]|uniref:X8 domain-containing protein n=1 Tax=Ceratodon purpureus TaxID=3225 RepID=A0A8T0IE34_CERPU|nr:hypothetical protein KC19_4G269100 [Ceratodon purpureus]
MGINIHTLTDSLTHSLGRKQEVHCSAKEGVENGLDCAVSEWSGVEWSRSAQPSPAQPSAAESAAGLLNCITSGVLKCLPECCDLLTAHCSLLSSPAICIPCPSLPALPAPCADVSSSLLFSSCQAPFLASLPKPPPTTCTCTCTCLLSPSTPLRPLAQPPPCPPLLHALLSFAIAAASLSHMAPLCALPLVLGLLLLLPVSGTADASLLEFSHRSSREKVSSPEEVVRLLKDHAVTRFRLYDANHSILRALGNSSINVIVGVRNGEVEDLANDSENARKWIERNVLPFVKDTNVTAIAVGDESSTRALPHSVKQVQAMRNLHQALVKAKLGNQIEVASPRTVSEYSNDLSFASLKSSMPAEEQGFELSLDENLAKHRRLADDRGFVWCVVLRNSDVYAVQTALNWACARINCGPTYVGGTCFIPNTIWDHASWAFNAYYNSMNGAQDACNFSGTAYVSSNDPSSEQCFYQGTNSALAVNSACMQGRTVILSSAVALFAFLLVLFVL